MIEPEVVRKALVSFDPLWDQLTTAEQERFIRTLVQEVRYDGQTQMVTVGFRSEGIKELAAAEAATIEKFAARNSISIASETRCNEPGRGTREHGPFAASDTGDGSRSLLKSTR